MEQSTTGWCQHLWKGALSRHVSLFVGSIVKQPQLVLYHPKSPSPHKAASHSNHSCTQSHAQTSATQPFRAMAAPTHGLLLHEAAAKTPALPQLHEANHGHQLNCLYIQNEGNTCKELGGWDALKTTTKNPSCYKLSGKQYYSCKKALSAPLSEAAAGSCSKVADFSEVGEQI